MEEPIETVLLDASDKRIGEVGKTRGSFMLKVYREMNLDKRYFIGVDTSGGVGKDSSAFTIVDPIDLAPVATFKHNKINVNQYSTLLENLVTDILPNSILVIERNSMGKGVVDLLVRRIPDKVYYDVRVPDKHKDKQMHQTDNIVYGVDNTSTSREAMIDILTGIVNDEPHNLAIKEIYDEVRTLVYTTSGKVEHDRGCHDDVLFAYLFVRYVINFGRSIAKFLRGARTLSNNVDEVASITGSRIISPSKVNRTQHVSEEVASLSVEELMRIVDSGTDVASYVKEKFGGAAARNHQLSINNTTLGILRS